MSAQIFSHRPETRKKQRFCLPGILRIAEGRLELREHAGLNALFRLLNEEVER